MPIIPELYDISNYNNGYFTPTAEMKKKKESYEKDPAVPIKTTKSETVVNQPVIKNVQSLPKVKDPSFISDAINIALSTNRLTKNFIKQPYSGTEEEARNLGYKTYRIPGELRRHSVDYSTEKDNDPAATQVEKAAAQMKKYGIPADRAKDKSSYDKLMYEYLPAYGYNIGSFVENIIDNKKVSDASTGTAVILGKDRKNKADGYALDPEKGRLFKTITEKIFGQDAVDYSPIDASLARQDYRNLH